MRRAIALTIGCLILGYCLFTVGLSIMSSLVFGDEAFSSLDELKEPVAKTLWYMDSIVCPIIAALLGILSGGLARNGAWKIAAVSTVPMFAYPHLAKFPKMEVSVVGELIRGGRYVAIGVVMALLVSRLKGRIIERGSPESYGPPPMPPTRWD